MGGRFGGFVSSSHFVVLDQPVAVDEFDARVHLRCFCCHEGEAACGYKVALIRRVVDIRERAEEVPYIVRRNLATGELLALDVVSLAVLARDDIDAAVVFPPTTSAS